MTAAELVRKKLDKLAALGSLVGIDPGGQTGWARYDGQKWEWGVISGVLELEELVEDAAVVVTEDFLLIPAKMKRATKEMVSPLKILGALEFLCRRLGIELSTVTPSERAAVKDLTEQVVGSKLPRHAREAAQVLVSYIVKLSEKGV